MYFAPKKSDNSRLGLSHLKTIHYWHRPGGGLVEVIEKMREKGITDPTLLGTSYMELYIGSLLGLGLQESEKLDFWIGKPKEDPPDLAFMTMVFDEKERLYFHSREVEITRYRKQDKSLIQTILDKDKHYPGDYIIVCFLEFNGHEELKKISEELIGQLKNIHHVFLVFHGMHFVYLKEPPRKEDLAGKTSIVQLSPIFSTQEINLKESLEKWRLDNKKLAYLDNAKVFYGKRDEETIYPKIIKPN